MNPTAVANLKIKSVDSEVLVHDINGARVHILNGAAGEILQLCDGSRKLDEIISAFEVGKDTDPAVIREDVLRIIDDFTKLGIVSVS